jgi:hypothetical protein
MSDTAKSIDACAAYYGAAAEEMKAYLLMVSNAPLSWLTAVRWFSITTVT